MNIYCNTGNRVTMLVDDQPRYGTFLYDPHSIANIPSLNQVKERFHVSYDSVNGGIFKVTKPNGAVFEFLASIQGLFYVDTRPQLSKEAVVFLTTVADKKSKYSNEDYLAAVKAR
jgi:hypothetical protein